MDDLINEFELLNTTLLEKLPNCDYELLLDYVDKRENLLKEIQEQLVQSRITSFQKEKITSLIGFDDVIRSRMEQLRLEAEQWLMKRNQAKTQRNAYEVGYAPESILMDRRK